LKETGSPQRAMVPKRPVSQMTSSVQSKDGMANRPVDLVEVVDPSSMSGG
jgi:hypothetical protein